MIQKPKRDGQRDYYASAFLGVVDFCSALGAAFFRVALFLGVVGFAGVFVTRPDFVLPRTFGWSITAGAFHLMSVRGTGIYEGRSNDIQ